MANMPFELVGRRIMDGALCLIFKCAACDDKVSLIIRDTDPLKDRYPVSCMCGAEVNMFFGSPRFKPPVFSSLVNVVHSPPIE